MIDVGQKIRKALYNSLVGQITIDGKVVQLVDEKLDSNIADIDVYVMFTSQSETQRDLKNVWIREVDVVLQIINQRLTTNNREIVEDVSNQILNRLYPSKGVSNITIDSPLRLSYSTLIAADYNPIVQTENGFIVSKSLTLRNRITQ